MNEKIPSGNSIITRSGITSEPSPSSFKRKSLPKSTTTKRVFEIDSVRKVESDEPSKKKQKNEKWEVKCDKCDIHYTNENAVLNDKPTVECTRCNIWVHQPCYRFTDENPVPDKFLCNSCKYKIEEFDFDPKKIDNTIDFSDVFEPTSLGLDDKIEDVLRSDEELYKEDLLKLEDGIRLKKYNKRSIKRRKKSKKSKKSNGSKKNRSKKKRSKSKKKLMKKKC